MSEMIRTVFKWANQEVTFEWNYQKMFQISITKMIDES